MPDRTLYIGAMNDKSWFIDQPPRPSNDYINTNLPHTNVIASWDEIVSALAAAGWAVVPVEPDRKMSDAGKYAMKGSTDMLWERERAIVVFKAMIAAAKGEA